MQQERIAQSDAAVAEASLAEAAVTDTAVAEAKDKGKLTRLLQAIAGLWVLFVLGRTVQRLGQLILGHMGLPQWDEAKYGLAGLHLARFVQELDFLAALVQIRELAAWPPLLPLLEAPAFLLFGPGFWVPRLLVLACLAASALLLLRVGRGLHQSHGWWVGCVAAVGLLGGLLPQVFSALNMLEMPGVLLGLLALSCYLHALDREQPSAELPSGRVAESAPRAESQQNPRLLRRAWRWTAISATLLFFCKYNYGLMWLVPVVVAEARRRLGSWRGVLIGLGKLRTRVNPRRPWHLFMILAIGFLLLIRFSGGIDTEVLGLRIRATSLGNPVYALYLIVLLRLALRWPKHNEHWRAAWRRLGVSDRAWLAWTVLPIALWMLDPLHTKDFFKFVENRSSGPEAMSWSGVAFYPAVLAERCASQPWLGWLALIGAGVFLLRLPWLGDRQRILALVLGAGSVALWLHPYKLERFIITLLPWIWLAAALSWVHMAAWLAQWLGRPRHALGPRKTPALGLVGAGLTLILMLVAGWRAPAVEVLRSELEWRTVPTGELAALEQVIDLSESGPRTLVIGTWNLFSPALLDWFLHLHQPESVEERLPRHMWPGARGLRDAQRWLESGQVTRAVVLDYRGAELRAEAFQAGADQRNALLAVLRRPTDTSPAWSLVAEEVPQGSSYGILVYDLMEQ